MNVQQLFPAQHHPVVISPTGGRTAAALCELVAEQSDAIGQLLLQHGAVLFRGFQIEGAEHFKSCAESTGAQPLNYVGGSSPRSRIAADVYTATDAPGTEVVRLHNEMSYLHRWPRRIFFFCGKPAPSGGQTTLANGADVRRALPAQIVSRMREKKLTYIRNFHPGTRLGRSWQSAYWTEDRAEAESIIAAQGSTYQWAENGSLRVSTVCDALTRHPVTGDEVWFNQAEMYHPSALDPGARARLEQALGRGRLPYDCEYGDGDPLEDEVLAEIRAALGSARLLFDWQHGDVLMMDNVLMMHGREPFRGERTTLVYLSST